jgi:hypothetical protein
VSSDPLWRIVVERKGTMQLTRDKRKEKQERKKGGFKLGDYMMLGVRLISRADRIENSRLLVATIIMMPLFGLFERYHQGRPGNTPAAWCSATQGMQLL